MASEKSKVRVAVSKNGPYIVTGDIPLAKQTIATDAEGGSEAWQKGPAVAHRETYALCRCGASQTKPFCDGSIGAGVKQLTPGRYPHTKKLDVRVPDALSTSVPSGQQRRPTMSVGKAMGIRVCCYKEGAEYRRSARISVTRAMINFVHSGQSPERNLAIS